MLIYFCDKHCTGYLQILVASVQDTLTFNKKWLNFLSKCTI